MCIGNMLNGIVTDLQRSSNRRHWTYEDTGTGYIDPNGNDGTDWDAFHDHYLCGRSLYANSSMERAARRIMVENAWVTVNTIGHLYDIRRINSKLVKQTPYIEALKR